jgi:hypothetical protein
MILNELFTTTGNVEWTRNNSRWEGKFTVDKVPFVILFDNESEEDGPRKWGCLFKVTDTYARANNVRVCGNTGMTGHASVKVMSVVVNELEKFLVAQKPDVVEFAGGLLNGKADLYTAMARALSRRAASNGYEVKMHEGDCEMIFLITRRETRTSAPGTPAR